jgi:hypothetical protein
VPGTNTLEARAGSLQGSPVVFTAEGESTPARFVFLTQPQDVSRNQLFNPAVQVAVVDAGGNLVPISGVEIRIDLLRSNGPTANSRLDGDRTVDTVNGVAVFSDLSVDRNEDGYRLRASSPDLSGLAPVVSDAFNVN